MAKWSIKYMEIKYKEKPSQELVKKCEKKLTEFLRAQNIIIKIIVRDEPLVIYGSTSINGSERIESRTNYWIDNVVIITRDEKNISLEWWEAGLRGLEEDINDLQLWSIAYDIQNAFYRKLGVIIYPPNRCLSDPYWKLWEDNKELLNIKDDK
ncbi:MAG: hypothetical protein PHR36_00965 [Patescibacteria group bacterium]|nr:hypothetical protein [Patescibacteria group bacterium]